MFKIVKYRYHYADYFRSAGWSGWHSVVPKTFQHIFNHLPDNVLTVDARIYKQISGYSLADSEYKIVDAWDWLRFGFSPFADELLKSYVQKMPDKYRLSKNGVWIRRNDLLR